MNNCSFIGRMGANPKFFAASGEKKSALMFSLAVKKEFQVQQGQPDCDWLEFKAFGKQAEIINQYVAKGNQLGVVARATVEKWKDQQGQERQSVRFLVSSITFVDKKDSGSGNSGSYNNNHSSNNSQQKSHSYTPVDDEDLPF